MEETLVNKEANLLRERESCLLDEDKRGGFVK